MYNYMLKNATIVDGNRTKPYKSNLYIKDDKISKISEELLESENIIDCEGLIVSPGFIDVHTHSDSRPLNKKNGESMVNQGVTTQIGGNCGITFVPSTEEKFDEINAFFSRTVQILPEKENRSMLSMKDYVEEASKNKLLINSGLLIGHGTIRAVVMGFEDRKATPEELGEMKKLLAKQLEEGAVGMSLGLIYPPSSYGDVEEFVELSKVLKEYDAVLTVHMRNENAGVFDSVDEMLKVAEKSGVHLQISHLKLMGTPNWGRAKELLEKIEDSRKKGATITCDQYPYEASSTGLAALVPGWALSGGNEAMIKNLKDNSEKIRTGIEEIMNIRGGADRVLITSTLGAAPEFDGKTIKEISEITGKEPVDTVIDLLIKCNGAAAAVYFSMNEDDVIEIMKSMDICIGSDGMDFPYDIDYNPHPRSFGTFPRFLQTVRDKNLMPLEDAIYKVSKLPADIIGIKDRGEIAEGKIADLTIFDYDKVREESTFEKSVVRPEGFRYVFVSGAPALIDGEVQDNFNGKIILRK